ncbi:MAG: autotransporter outer membrane beta-barrel domain-containing protein, partial [Thiohalocapsa sp.]
YGAFAQSIGGGGGDAADAASSETALDADLTVNLGGSNGVGGNGGAVSVDFQGDDGLSSVSTSGRAAIGIFAQSVGGGGGKGATGVDASFLTLSVGGQGDAGGDGGAVNVAVRETSVLTQANLSPGIVAQSIGGGGGYAGDVKYRSTGSFGSGIDIGSGAANYGDGSDVGVVIAGGSRVETRGNNAPGIFAQSVGGGGGVSGIGADGASGARIGSAGGSGKAGTVAVMVGADTLIATSGRQSHAIFAQSVGGGGDSTIVGRGTSVTVNGTVSATGPGAHGIYAQSAGDGRGQVVVDVDATGRIVGGSASRAAAEQGAAIFVKDGTSNRINNTGGIIESSVGATGVAIASVGEGTTQVFNLGGTIIGSVILTEASSLSNESGGTLGASRIVAGQTLNRGNLAVGGAGEIATTMIQGAYMQASEGTLSIDLDPEKVGSGEPISDELIIEGAADLSGTVEITLLSTEQGEAGEVTTRIVRTADDQVSAASAADLEVRPSVVAQYQLSSDADDDTLLSFDIDYVNANAAAPMNNNTFDASQSFNQLALAGGVSDAIAVELISFSDPEAYATFMDRLNPEVFVNNQIMTVRSNLLFNKLMAGCGDNGSAYRSVDHDRCFFMSWDAGRLDRSANASNEGFDSNWWQITAGGEVGLNQDWRVGGALSYQSRDQETSSHNNSTSDGDGLLAGLRATRSFGPMELTGSVAAGYGWFDTTRNPLSSGVATASQSIWTLSTRIGAGYRYGDERLYVRPRIDFGYDFVDGSSFSEAGSNPYRLAVDGGGDSFFTLQPSVEVGANFKTDQGQVVRARLSAGIVQFLGNSSASMTARYVHGSASVPSFRASTDLGSTQLELGGSLDIVRTDAITLRADGFVSLNSVYSDYGGGLAIAIPF